MNLDVKVQKCILFGYSEMVISAITPERNMSELVEMSHSKNRPHGIYLCLQPPSTLLWILRRRLVRPRCPWMKKKSDLYKRD